VLICWPMPTFRRNILSPSSRAEVTSLSFATYGNKKPAPKKSTTHSGDPWKGPFPSLNPLPTQAPPWNLTVGSLLVRMPVIYSFPLIGSLPSALALLVLYKPSISLPCHFSAGRWRQYVSPKRRHRPTYQHGAKIQKLKKTRYLWFGVHIDFQ
jgi:hypothetical protein